jgi:hypothetical protein
VLIRLRIGYRRSIGKIGLDVETRASAKGTPVGSIDSLPPRPFLHVHKIWVDSDNKR